MNESAYPDNWIINVFVTEVKTGKLVLKLIEVSVSEMQKSLEPYHTDEFDIKLKLIGWKDKHGRTKYPINRA